MAKEWDHTWRVTFLSIYRLRFPSTSYRVKVLGKCHNGVPARFLLQRRNNLLLENIGVVTRSDPNRSYDMAWGWFGTSHPIRYSVSSSINPVVAHSRLMTWASRWSFVVRRARVAFRALSSQVAFRWKEGGVGLVRPSKPSITGYTTRKIHYSRETLRSPILWLGEELNVD